jgi:hypothetical protein
MMRSLVLGAIAAPLTLVAVSGSVPRSQPSPVYAVAEAPADLRPAVQRGDLLIVSLQAALVSELRRDLDEGGLSAALASCHIDTTDAAYRLARAEGIAAGRTASRLRDPTNAPRPWAAPIVARYADSRARDVSGFVVDLGDRVGLIRPIVEQASCAACHGPVANIDARVRATLSDRYPADRAVGFKDGDIRGWFWVEIPKRRWTDAR